MLPYKGTSENGVKSENELNSKNALNYKRVEF
jgi:hypothetical protein